MLVGRIAQALSYLPKARHIRHISRITSAEDMKDNPLIRAILTGDTPAMKSLLACEKVAEPHYWIDCQPLSLAMSQRNARTLNGASVWGMDPADSLAMIDALLAADANPSQKDDKGMSPAIYAVRAGDLEALKRMRPKLDFKQLHFGGNRYGTERDSISLLAVASFYGHLDVIDFMLKAGADAKLGEWPPLIAAIMAMDRSLDGYVFIKRNLQQRILLIKKLAEAGADANALLRIHLTSDSNTKPYYKIHPGLSWLNFWRPSDTLSALDCAARINKQLVNALLEVGASPDGHPDCKIPPLFYAAESKNDETTEALLLAGAKLDQASPRYGSAIFAAARKGNLAMFNRLLKAGASTQLVLGNQMNLLHYAALGGNIDIIQALLAEGFNVNSIDAIGNTPLHYAAEYNQAPAIALLCLNGARMDQANSMGRVALHTAAEHASALAISDLLKRGMNANFQDHEGNTPLHDLVKANTGSYDDNGATESMIALLKAGADPKIRNKEGKKPAAYFYSDSQICMNWEMLYVYQQYRKSGLAALVKFQQSTRLYVESQLFNIHGFQEIDPMMLSLKARVASLPKPIKSWRELSEAERVQYAFHPGFEEAVKIHYYRGLCLLIFARDAAAYALSHFNDEHKRCLEKGDLYPELYVAMAIVSSLVQMPDAIVGYLGLAKSLAGVKTASIWQDLCAYLPSSVQAHIQPPAEIEKLAKLELATVIMQAQRKKAGDHQPAPLC